MSADRYELHADHTDWLDVRDPQGYRNTINQPGAVALIRQQARDIAELRTENAAILAANRDMQMHFDAMQDDLAAAVAERDEARTAYQVRNTEWHRHELIALALAERYNLRAEQAEARLAAIEATPVVEINQ